MFSARLQVRPVPSGSTLTLVTVPSSTSIANLLHLETLILNHEHKTRVIPDTAQHCAQIQFKLKSFCQISTCIS